MSFKLRFSVLLLVIPLFTSCLRVGTDIQLKKNGSVTAALEYTFSSDVADFGRGFGSDEPWFLPLTEKDFIQHTLRYPGVELTRYKNRTNSSGDEIVLAELRGESLDHLSEFLSLDMKAEIQGSGGTFTISLPRLPEELGSSGEMKSLLESAAGDITFQFRLRPPSRPKSAVPGTIHRGEAEFQVSLTDLLNGNAPQSWIVAW